MHFTTFLLDGQEIDLCPSCTKTLKGWIEGEITLELPERAGVGG